MNFFQFEVVDKYMWNYIYQGIIAAESKEIAIELINELDFGIRKENVRISKVEPFIWSNKDFLLLEHVKGRLQKLSLPPIPHYE